MGPSTCSAAEALNRRRANSEVTSRARAVAAPHTTRLVRSSVLSELPAF